MAIIEKEPIHGPPRQGLVFMVVVMCAAILGLLLVGACGTATRARPAAATLPAACKGMQAWAKAGGTGALAEMNAGMQAITNDMKAGDVTALQADGIAMSQITQLSVVSNAPPVAVTPWVDMVLDLNKAGQALTGADVETAGPYVYTARHLYGQVIRAVAKCGL